METICHMGAAQVIAPNDFEIDLHHRFYHEPFKFPYFIWPFYLFTSAHVYFIFFSQRRLESQREVVKDIHL